MFVAIFIVLLPTIGTCSGEGNIHLFEDEFATAIKACEPEGVQDYKDFNQRVDRNTFKQRHQYPGEDSDTKNSNQYSFEKKNTTKKTSQNKISTKINTDFLRYDNQYGQIRNHSPSTFLNYFVQNTPKRIKRSKQMNNKNIESDQCLSQCVFAKLHMVDKRGIPREEDFFNKIRTTMKSQKSRASLEDQIRKCFRSLQTEAADACSYSNKLEHCLKLRFADRINGHRRNQTEKKSCFN